MTEDSDLGGGSLSDEDRDLTGLNLREERQRLKWKTGVLAGSSVIIAAFYITALCVVLYLIFGDPPFLVSFEHGVILALLLAVPSLTAIQLFKLVSKNAEMTPEDFDSHPLVKLIRELFSIFKK